MKKFVMTCFFAFLLWFSLAAFADEPFSLEVGTGHIWTGSGNYMATLDKAEWQYSLAAGMELTERHNLTLGVAHDGVKVTTWMQRHNFMDSVPEMHHYTAVDLLYGYTLNPNDKAKVTLELGPTWYRAGDLDKAGITAGAVLKYPLATRLYASVALRFRHVQDFIVPVANVVETRFALGFRF